MSDLRKKTVELYIKMATEIIEQTNPRNYLEEFKKKWFKFLDDINDPDGKLKIEKQIDQLYKNWDQQYAKHKRLKNKILKQIKD